MWVYFHCILEFFVVVYIRFFVEDGELFLTQICIFFRSLGCVNTMVILYTSGMKSSSMMIDLNLSQTSKLFYFLVFLDLHSKSLQSIDFCVIVTQGHGYVSLFSVIVMVMCPPFGGAWCVRDGSLTEYRNSDIYRTP